MVHPSEGRVKNLKRWVQVMSTMCLVCLDDILVTKDPKNPVEEGEEKNNSGNNPFF